MGSVESARGPMVKGVRAMRNMLPLRSSPTGDRNRRATGRVAGAGLSCGSGRVMDMSPSGARIIAKLPWKEGDRRPVTLRAGGVGVTVDARCVWRRREGLLRYVVGLAFEDVGADQAAGLAALVRSHAGEDEHGERRAA